AVAHHALAVFGVDEPGQADIVAALLGIAEGHPVRQGDGRVGFVQVPFQVAQLVVDRGFQVACGRNGAPER
nr:hypothetical protein [Tanacetum cinerariifolium]